MEEHKYTKEDLIYAIQEAYGHGRDEADDEPWYQVERSVEVIIKSIDNKYKHGDLCDKCTQSEGFYQGTICPKCKKPFRTLL